MRTNVLVVLMALALLASGAAAQMGDQGADDPMRARADRKSLESAAARAESLSASTTDPRLKSMYAQQASAARQRLAEGDLRVGDRIVLDVLNEPTYSDTFIVRIGQVLELPDLPAIPLRGVLRTELEGHLTTELERYIRTPRVRVLPLISLNVSGQVLAPGYHPLRTDALLRDVLAVAGGQTAMADLDKVVIKRDEEVLWNEKQAQTALREGWSIDELMLIGGDQIVIGARRQTNWFNVVQLAGGILGIVIGIVALSNR